jgi:hypothetical protein
MLATADSQFKADIPSKPIKIVSQVPTGYLKWLAANVDLKEPLKTAVYWRLGLATRGPDYTPEPYEAGFETPDYSPDGKEGV